MTSRTAESRLATVTLVYLAFYIPIETWASWPSLLSSYYLVDAMAMGLLLWGALHSLAARPRRAPGLLAVGWAWAAANYWRAFFGRLGFIEQGGALQLGAPELWTVGGAFVLALVCLGFAAAMTATRDQ